jgi:hypothetical protein
MHQYPDRSLNLSNWYLDGSVATHIVDYFRVNSGFKKNCTNFFF